MEDAELYSISNKLPLRDAHLCLEEYTNKIKWKQNNNRIIDIGSGDGGVTAILKQYIPTPYTVLGSDINIKMVDFANRKHSNEQTSFTVLDIEGALPEGMKRNFNLVFSSYTLHWIVDQERAFRNIYELMEEGGDCLLIFLANMFVFDVYRELARNNKWASLLHNVEHCISPYIDSQEPDKEITAIMESIGFVDIDVQCKALSYFYDTELMKNLVQAVNPFDIPKHQYEDFMEDYYKVLQEMELVDKVDGDYVSVSPFNYRLLVVYGSKPYTI